MPQAYSKELLVDVFVHRYRNLSEDKVIGVRKLANDFYDVSGRDKFRMYACVTPEAIREYKQYVHRN